MNFLKRPHVTKTLSTLIPRNNIYVNLQSSNYNYEIAVTIS